MSSLLIVGAGGHGRVVADAALLSGRWARLAFVDDAITDPRGALGLELVGTTNDLDRLRSLFDHVVVAIGQAGRRSELLSACRSLGYRLAIVQHRSAAVSPFARVDAGTVVLAQAAVNAGASVAEGCIVNTGATVDHDCRLGEAVHVCPGAHLAGGVSVGDRSWIGIGACIREGITVGRNVTVGAGAVVVEDVPDHATVVGNPARRRKADLPNSH